MLINQNYNLKSNKINNSPSFGAKVIPYEVGAKYKKLLLKGDTVDIYCHMSPDDDTVNSMKVFAGWLKRHGKKVSVCINPAETKHLYFSPKKYTIKTGSQISDAVLPDVALVLDFNGKSRIDKAYINEFEKCKPENVVCFDHHIPMENPIEGNVYRDETAMSCCSIVYRFFESIGEKLKKNELKSLYCGILSDYSKSKLVEVSNNDLIKFSRLDEDKNSKEILERIEKQLDKKDRIKIYKHLDILSNLTKEEKALKKHLYSKVEVTKNGKLAYVVLDPEDEAWRSAGMDGTRTSAILRELREKLVSDQTNKNFSPEQQKKIKDAKGAIIFYRKKDTADSTYQMSFTAKGNYAQELVDYIRANINPNLQEGGHPNRRGGKIYSIAQNEVNAFINSFLTAAEKVD